MAIVTVIAKVIAKPHAIAAVKAELINMLEPTRNEQGCLEYRLHQDNADPALFMFYENWADQHSLEQHLTSDHFRAYIAAVDGLVADKEVHTLTEL